MKVYLLYSGNAWLNTSSLQLLAVCTTLDSACSLASAHSKEGEEPLEDDELAELMDNRHTYGRDENYLICETQTDELDG